MVKIKKNLIFLGIQGSGKTTQAEKFAKKYNYIHIGAGNLIRNYIKNNEHNSKFITNIVDNGLLLPSDILFKKILTPLLTKITKKKPIIFDGIPRNIAQFKKFNKIIKKLNINEPILVYFKIPQRIVIERIKYRKICPICNKVYGPANTEYKKNICIKDKTNLIKRKDDTKEKIKKRIDIFQRETAYLIKYFKNNKKYIEINAEPSILEVNKKIITKLNDLFKK